MISMALAACGGGGSAGATKSTTSPATSATTATTAVATGNSGAPSSAQGSKTATSNPGTPPGGGGGAGAAFAPAATGEIASITGNILEVQDTETESQTTVNLTTKTRISDTVTVKLADVKVGSCVTATGTKGASGALDASNITISAAVNGKCGGAGGVLFGGGGGGAFPRGGFGGPGRAVTSGSVPSTARSGATARAGDFASGKVTAVSGTTITLEGRMLTFSGQRTTTSAPASARTFTSVPLKAVDVDVSASTKYTKTEIVSPAALKVGECATAIGSTNDIGAVTATRLTVTPPLASGGCFTFTARGFGGGGFTRGSGGGGFPGSGGSGGFPGGGGPAAT